MQTFTTQAQAVAYLVEQGKPANLAQAMVTEFYNFDSTPADGLLRRADTVDSEENPIPVEQTEAQVDSMYRDWLGYGVEVTPDGITFDGELTYNLQGFYL